MSAISKKKDATMSQGQGRVQRGFTLIEVMIAVAILAIVAAIAYPSYTNATVKNRRASAQVVLSDITQRQQQYLMDNRSYTNSLGTLNVSVTSSVSDYYTVSIAVGTATIPTFTATATPLSGQSQVSDGALSITHDGTKSPAGKW
jgi:type IV pilus assembly protein PilE